MSEQKEPSFIEVVTQLYAILPKHWRYQIQKFIYEFERGGQYPFDEDGKPL